MRKAELEQPQTRIRTAGRNINYHRYADDTTLLAESEELKNLIKRVKEESVKNGLKLNSKKLRSWPLAPSPPGK